MTTPTTPTCSPQGRSGRVTIPNRIVQLPMGTSLIEHGPGDRARGPLPGGARPGRCRTDHHRRGDRPRDLALSRANPDRGMGRGDHRLAPTPRGGGQASRHADLRTDPPSGTRAAGRADDQVPGWGPSPIASPRNPDVPHEMTVVRGADDHRRLRALGGELPGGRLRRGGDPRRPRLPHRPVPLARVEPADRRVPRRHARRPNPFLFEVVEEIRTRCGEDLPIGVRLSADEETADGLTLDDALEIVDLLQTTRPGRTTCRSPSGCADAYIKDSSFRGGLCSSSRRGGQAARRRTRHRRRTVPACRTSPSVRWRRARPTSSAWVGRCSPTPSGRARLELDSRLRSARASASSRTAGSVRRRVHLRGQRAHRPRGGVGIRRRRTTEARAGRCGRRGTGRA